MPPVSSEAGGFILWGRKEEKDCCLGGTLLLGREGLLDEFLLGFKALTDGFAIRAKVGDEVEIVVF